MKQLLDNLRESLIEAINSNYSQHTVPRVHKALMDIMAEDEKREINVSALYSMYEQQLFNLDNIDFALDFAINTDQVLTEGVICEGNQALLVEFLSGKSLKSNIAKRLYHSGKMDKLAAVDPGSLSYEDQKALLMHQIEKIAPLYEKIKKKWGSESWFSYLVKQVCPGFADFNIAYRRDSAKDTYAHLTRNLTRALRANQKASKQKEDNKPADKSLFEQPQTREEFIRKIKRFRGLRSEYTNKIERSQFDFKVRYENTESPNERLKIQSFYKKEIEELNAKLNRTENNLEQLEQAFLDKFGERVGEH